MYFTAYKILKKLLLDFEWFSEYFVSRGIDICSKPFRIWNVLTIISYEN